MPLNWALSSRVGFALVAALYCLSLPYHPGLRSPNELCRLWQARSLIDFGTLNINGALRQFGGVGDLSCTRVVQLNGLQTLKPCVGPDAPTEGVIAQYYYPSKAPLISFLGAPVYWVLEKLHGHVGEIEQVAWSRLFVVIVPALLMLVLLRRFLRTYLSSELTDLLVVVYGLGTMAFSYAEAFMSHQLTAALLFAAFYCAWRIERRERSDRHYLLAGFISSLVVASEYTGALGVLCVAAFVITSRWQKWSELAKSVMWVVVGALPVLLALMAYHHACYGGPFVSGYKYLNDANYQHWHVGGFLGIRLPNAAAFGLSYFSPLRGLFVLSPFLLPAMWGVRDGLKNHRALAVFLIVLLVGNAYFTSSFDYDSWGWTVGPRHLTPMLPFLMLPLGWLLERLKSSSPLAFAAVLGACATAVLVTGVVGFVNYVPDDVSTSFWALAVPLLKDGYWPVSWLAAFVPNPVSGGVLIALVIAAVCWVFLRAVRIEKASPAVMLVVMVGHLVVLRTFTKYDDHDTNARAFLEQQWVAPVGRTLPWR